MVKYKIRKITILKVRTKHGVVTYISLVAPLSVSLVKYKIREITILKVRTKHGVVTYISWVAHTCQEIKNAFI